MFARLGGWCARRPWTVIALWVLVAVTAGAALSGIGGSRTRTVFSLPDVESRAATEILDERFAGQGGGWRGSIVFVADQGVDDPGVRDAVSEMLTEVDAIPGTTVTSPYGPQGERQVASRGDLAGRLAYASVELPSQRSAEDAEDVRERTEALVPDVRGLDVELGGEVFATDAEPRSEVVGVAFAIVILIVAFGSVLAMGLPIGVGLAGIGVGTLLAGFASRVLEMPSFAQMIGIMLGLGVGIDYALFIITRVRENRRAGLGVEESISGAIGTAGRAVAFAGATVVISVLGLILMGLDFVTGLAISAAIVVAVTMLASLTLLPALLAFVGHRLEVTRLRGVVAAGLVSIALVGVGFSLTPLLVALPLAAVVLVAGLAWAPLRRELPPRKQRPIEETVAFRWSRVIQQRPWPAAVAGSLVLLVIAVPLLGIRLGFSDDGNDPADTTTRRAYDLLADGFGPGYNGPLVLTSLVPEGTDRAAVESVAGQVSQALNADDGVAEASPPIFDDPASPSAVMWQVIPTTSPQDERTTDLVRRLRADTLPAVTGGSDLDVAVAGTVAINADFSDYLADRMPLFFAGVLTLSFGLLLVVFRSILVPLKAVVMNLLGIGAAYGVLVAGFQWGWLGPVLGIDSGPIEPFLPMVVFAIVFGISMDYEVFLLSRIKEDWDRTGDSRTSVANGVSATARVITAAALIMVVVFAAFALDDDRVIKLVGVGLASAVFLDATVIRMLLVPATMELLGDRNWWLPGWLDRLLPTLDVEGHQAPPERSFDPIPEPIPELEPTAMGRQT
jgi:putative drug exporter of the RND superfamily